MTRLKVMEETEMRVARRWEGIMALSRASVSIWNASSQALARKPPAAQQGQAAGERQSGSGGDPGQTEEPRQPVGQPFQQQGGAGAGHAAQSH